MKFNIIIDVPDEMILTYKEFIVKNKEQNLKLDLEDKDTIESLLKDMLEEMTTWDVEKCTLLDIDK
jgi:hypothetical protein